MPEENATCDNLFPMPCQKRMQHVIICFILCFQFPVPKTSNLHITKLSEKTTEDDLKEIFVNNISVHIIASLEGKSRW